MSESEMPRRRGPGRPREYASDADRARAWRARERVRRATFRGECDVGQVLEQLQTVTEQRDRNWEQVERLQVENARLRDGRTALTSPTEPSKTIDDLRAELDAAHHREVGWQQQAVDLLALLERLSNITGSDPLIREIGARSQLAAKHGELLGPIEAVRSDIAPLTGLIDGSLSTARARLSNHGASLPSGAASTRARAASAKASIAPID